MQESAKPLLDHMRARLSSCPSHVTIAFLSEFVESHIEAEAFTLAELLKPGGYGHVIALIDAYIENQENAYKDGHMSLKDLQDEIDNLHDDIRKAVDTHQSDLIFALVTLVNSYAEEKQCKFFLEPTFDEQTTCYLANGQGYNTEIAGREAVQYLAGAIAQITGKLPE